ncbi:hypothetical protein DOY81_006501 [Sarcophaga bullata]|nr:hypothetical protein DOY81_006501 [Sarcophaga bullata]
MKSFFALLCIFLAIFAYVQADECKIDGKVYKVGEKFTKPGQCIEFTCTGPEAFSAHGCSEAKAVKSCKLIPEDNSKPYPQCCPPDECKIDGKVYKVGEKFTKPGQCIEFTCTGPEAFSAMADECKIDGKV